MVEQNEVLLADIHAAALTGDLPRGVYPVSVTVRLDRAQSADRKIPELGPPEYPAQVLVPTEQSARIPSTTVWVENPALMDTRGSKPWEHREFSAKINDEIEQVRNKWDPDARDRFYITKTRIVEIVDKSWLIEDSEGRWRPESDFFYNHGEMTIATFDKRPTITNEDVREKLKKAGSLSGEVRQPLRLTQYTRAYARPHNPAQSTRRFWTEERAEADPSVEAHNVRPRTYKIPEKITEADEDRIGVLELRVGLDQVEDHFPALSGSHLWLNVKFFGEIDMSDRFVETDVVVRPGGGGGATPAVADGGDT